MELRKSLELYAHNKSLTQLNEERYAFKDGAKVMLDLVWPLINVANAYDKAGELPDQIELVFDHMKSVVEEQNG